MNSLNNSFSNNSNIIIKDFQVEFNPNDSTAVIYINEGVVNITSKQSLANKYNLIPKTTFHFTIIGSATGKKILELLSHLQTSERAEILKKIEHLCNITKWSVELKDEYYYLTKELKDEYYYLTKNYIEEGIPDEKRESIIQLAIINGLEKFYNELNNLLQTEFRVPFPHLTLFTNSTREDKKLRGIGIYSEKQFWDLKPVKII